MCGTNDNSAYEMPHVHVKLGTAARDIHAANGRFDKIHNVIFNQIDMH